MLCNVAKEKKRKKMHVLKFLRVNFSLLHCCVILFIYCIVIIITIFGFLIRCVEFIFFVHISLEGVALYILSLEVMEEREGGQRRGTEMVWSV